MNKKGATIKEKQRLWQEWFNVAAKALEPYGGTLEWTETDHQAFVYKGEGVCIVFYPYRRSAGSHYLRVRNQGSKNMGKCDAMMKMLYKAAGEDNIIFSRRNMPPHYRE